MQSALDIAAVVGDFTSTYGTGRIHELRDHWAAVSRRLGAGWREGYESVVMAVESQEAILDGRPLDLPPDCFEWNGQTGRLISRNQNID